jgi:molybdopterin molybdotransferase
MIGPFEALDKILENVNPKGTEIISVFDAIGRVISTPVVSKRSLPGKDNSAMDGFAVKYEDIKNIPVKLKQVGVIAAGDFKDYPELKNGECYRIMTGAFIPKGADTVVEFEVTKSENNTVEILKEKIAGANVRKAGEDIFEGDTIDLTGKKINEYMQSRFISTGNLFVRSYRKIKVAIIGTGDELDYPDSYDKIKIIDSNSHLIKAMFERNGAIVDYLGISTDVSKDFEEKLLDAADYDLIITSAGISFGDFDVVTNVTEKVGINWIFTTVNQKPGKPFSFGLLNGKPLLALPGNPVSAAFCAFFYGLPMLRKMQGLEDVQNTCIEAKLIGDMKKKNDRVHFNRVNVKFSDGNFVALPFASQDSHVIESISFGNGFMCIPSEMTGTIKMGTKLKVYIYDIDSVF